LKILSEKKAVVCRTILNGHSGAGIVIATNEEELVDAPLYVEYIPKKEEYRVHIFKGEVLHCQRKARKLEHPADKVNWQIRNHANGFIFEIKEPEDVPEMCIEQALLAVQAVGLDFGAVDVIWNEKQQKAYVLEINTAPGLEGSTLDKYVEAFIKETENE